MQFGTLGLTPKRFMVNPKCRGALTTLNDPQKLEPASRGSYNTPRRSYSRSACPKRLIKNPNYRGLSSTYKCFRRVCDIADSKTLTWIPPNRKAGESLKEQKSETKGAIKAS
jgi:hypothetical protein